MEGGGGEVKIGCEFLILICVCWEGGGGGVKVDKRIMRLGGGGNRVK